MPHSRKKDPFSLDTSLNIQRHKSRRLSAIDTLPEYFSQKPKQTLKGPVVRKRAYILASICFLVLSVLFIRLFSLQSDAGEYADQADNNRIRIISQEAPRGIVYDRNGIAMTKNSPDVGIFISLDDFPNEEEEQQKIFQKLAEYTGTVYEEILERYDEIKGAPPIEPVLLIDHISHDQAIMTSIHLSELEGVSVSPKILREYPLRNAVSNILGYTGKITEDEWSVLKTNDQYSYRDAVGKAGIEQQYESILKGTNGKQRVEVNAFGHVSKIVASEPSIEGSSITLSLDSELQQYVYDSMAKAAENSESTGGAAIIMNPNNGEILTLVSWPSYDDNIFSKGITQADYSALLSDPKKPLFNRAISGEYASGSTIKPLISAAALQEGLITKNTTVTSVGGIQVGIWSFPDWKAGGHGVTNVTKAIAESVNTFFYAIGGGYEDIEGLGVDRIRAYAEKFGLNAPLGIDIPGEADGFLPTKEWKEEVKGERWYVGDTYHLAIGQGDILVTPLQVASYISTIANGGTVYTPHLLRSIDGQLQQYTPVRESIIDEKNLQLVREGMRETVLSGSARSLQSVPISSAGKTGTAQFGSSEDKYHAWFTGFAPYENPQIVVAILLEGGGEGSATAVPLARDIFSWWANNRQ